MATLVAGDGTAVHPYAQALTVRGCPARDLADAVHALCLLHGRQPGAIEYAAAHDPSAAEGWLAGTAAAFSVERAWLARLTAAADPLPSTPGQAESEAAFAAQRHALDMLARSGRAGCAAGAAVALALDWQAIRRVLDAAGLRYGLAVPAVQLGNPQPVAALLDASSWAPGVERAMAFGAQQLLAQHRGLWELLEARASARSAR